MSNKISQKINKHKEGFLIVYKLAVDFLAISIVAMFLFLLAEGLIPGIATENIGFVKMAVFISADIMLLYMLGNLLRVNIKKETKKRSFWGSLVLLLTLLILSRMLKINIGLAIALLLSILMAGYFIWQLFFEEEKTSS